MLTLCIPAIRRPMISRVRRALPPGFIPPCLPTGAPSAPSGDQWWHEIKHDGIRVIARKEDKSVRLYSCPGNDLTHRFPLIVEALEQLRARSCIIDGEAVATGDDGIALFERRYRRHDASVFLYAFDLIELNGEMSAANRSKGAKPCSRRCCLMRERAYRSTSISRKMVRSPSSTPAAWAWRALSANARARAISPDARGIGSSRRTRMRPQ